MDWQTFFPAHSTVLALPNWESPRLFAPADQLSHRWQGAAFFPACRRRARLLRMALRLKAAAGYAQIRQSDEDMWPAGEFVRRVFPDFRWAAVYVGMAGAAQKKTARLFNSENDILGYLKTAFTEPAMRRLRNERDILSALPPGVGPEMAAYGPLADGEAMLLKPVPGRSLSPHALLPPPGIRPFLVALNTGDRADVNQHPGLQFARAHASDVGHYLDRLTTTAWPIVIQHGDFAPWNVFVTGKHANAAGCYAAIDWEYTNLKGFPFLDLAYYVLTVAAVMRHLEPAAAAAIAKNLLVTYAPRLTAPQADAMVALAAFDAYRKALDDGDSPDEPIQQWQRAIWQNRQATAPRDHSLAGDRLDSLNAGDNHQPPANVPVNQTR